MGVWGVTVKFYVCYHLHLLYWLQLRILEAKRISKHVQYANKATNSSARSEEDTTCGGCLGPRAHRLVFLRKSRLLVEGHERRGSFTPLETLHVISHVLLVLDSGTSLVSRAVPCL